MAGLRVTGLLFYIPLAIPIAMVYGTGSAGRSAQRHSFAAYGVGLAGAGETALDQKKRGG